jgi:hypothetical protein
MKTLTNIIYPPFALFAFACFALVNRFAICVLSRAQRNKFDSHL